MRGLWHTAAKHAPGCGWALVSLVFVMCTGTESAWASATPAVACVKEKKPLEALLLSRHEVPPLDRFRATCLDLEAALSELAFDDSGLLLTQARALQVLGNVSLSLDIGRSFLDLASNPGERPSIRRAASAALISLLHRTSRQARTTRSRDESQKAMQRSLASALMSAEDLHLRAFAADWIASEPALDALRVEMLAREKHPFVLNKLKPRPPEQ